VTKEYRELRSYDLFSDSFDDRCPAIVLTGAKSVGKSTALYALAVELTCTKKYPIILYFSTASLMCVEILGSYLNANECGSNLNMVVEKIL